MAAIMEEGDDATRAVFPKQAEIVDIAGDDDAIVPPMENVTESEPVDPCDTEAELEL